jgi:hypothetical protein
VSRMGKEETDFQKLYYIVRPKQYNFEEMTVDWVMGLLFMYLFCFVYTSPPISAFPFQGLHLLLLICFV